MQTWMVTSTAGPNRDLTRDTRQQPFWDEHAAFIDGLVDNGFIFLGGPLVDEGGAVIVVRADDEASVRAVLANDPWYQNGILSLASIKRWQIFIDQRASGDVSGQRGDVHGRMARVSRSDKNRQPYGDVSVCVERSAEPEILR